jgi:catechol 2,3-dioxygenase-like lactoylglutathione lyase family enzyme
MGYHHLALAACDMAAIHHFYEEVMGFELVKVEVAPVPDGGWAKHFFYRMDGDDSKFIAFWELHDVPGTERLETNLSRAAGVPDFINHIAFAVPTADELARRKEAGSRPIARSSRSTTAGATRSTPRTRTTTWWSSASRRAPSPPPTARKRSPRSALPSRRSASRRRASRRTAPPRAERDVQPAEGHAVTGPRRLN